MKFFDYIRLAFRNIGRQKLRTALTIFAVVIGATSVTIMLALVSGAKDFFVAQFERTGQLQQVAVSQATDLDYRQAQGGGGGGGGGGGAAPVKQPPGAGPEATPTPDTTIRLNDAMIAKIKGLPHVVSVAPTAFVGGWDSLLYQGQKLNVNGPTAYDPNGTIRHDVVAGRDLQESDGASTVTLTTGYADKLGFKQNYGALVGKTITLRTMPNFSGEGAVLPPAPTCNTGSQGNGPAPGQGQGQPPAPGGGGCGPPQQNQQPTDLSATVVGVTASTGGQEGIDFPLSWARGLLETRMWGQTAADQKAAKDAQQAYQQALQSCTQTHSCSSQSLARPAPPPFTLITQNQLDLQGYSGIIVQVDTASNADQVAAGIRGFGVGAVSADSFIKQQEGIFNILALILGGIGAIALAVAAIGVVNTMVMAILERTREIGVMRACGATRATVRRLFTFEAALLGFWGGVLGVLLGFALTLVANPIINDQLKLNSISGTNIITLPPWLILGVVGATTLIGILAGLYPAARAARLNPVEALRYE